MSEVNVQLNNGPAAQMAAPVTVGEALKKLDRDAAKQALAARVNGREVDLAFTLDAQQNGDALQIEPVLPQTLEGLDVLRHSTAHLLAAAVLDLFPGTKLGIGPALLDDPRYGFFYDVIAPRPLTEADLPVIEKRMRQIASRNLAYRRDEISKAEALRIFARARRAAEVRADRRESGRDGQCLLHRQFAVHRFLSRPARSQHEQAARV